MTEWEGLLKRERTSLALAPMDYFSNCIIPFILIVSVLEGRAFHSPYLFIDLYQQGFIYSYFIQRVIILNDYSFF